MNFIEFNDISFAYPPVEGDVDENGQQIIPPNVFEHFTGTLPAGFVSLMGPNGCGKSTLMLLAAGRIAPQTGSIKLFGQDITNLEEEKKNLLASVIYQNMEFETDDKVDQLLSYVYSSGNLKAKAKGIKGDDLFSEVIDQFELKNVLNHGLNGISKGENQRVLLAFSLLYGSASVFMDEPLFAMEEKQKESALDYLRSYSKATNTPIYISMHELDLTRKYAENVLLIKPSRDMSFGTPEEVMTREEIEAAYGIPESMLKHQESMTRDVLRGHE